ncbi:major capsid protein [Inquilinus sp. OTU3971]|uniref:major capsid protein n=1 Tax=Inquilinus sp. OTU3971 TaxID=3043855 RepID=UPI00313B4946
MPLLRAEAEKLSNNQLEAGVIEEIIEKDELFALLPFMHVVGKAYVYNREKTLSEGDFIDVNEDVPEGAATFDEVISRLARLAGDVDVDKFLNETMDDSNDQLAIQIASKAKGLGRAFRRTLVNGDRTVNAKAFDGVRVLTAADQTLIAGDNGGAVALSALDELLDAVPNGADAIMMRKGTWRGVRGLLRAFGGNDAVMMQLENFGKPVPSYNGTPVILNDFLPANEVQGTANETTSIYAMRLNEADGLHGIYGGRSAGIIVEDIGTVQTRDATRTRLKWYCGLALKSTKSMARLRGITNL